MHLETDYLIVGGGASGMAFVDTLLAESDAQILVVDNNHSPGGHWNHAYPFVRLHQPSAYYGVASTSLGAGTTDLTGPNAGLSEIANGSEICGYFQRILEHKFLPSGRVKYMPNCEYRGDGTIYARLTGETHTSTVRRKTVFTSYTFGSIPETHQPKFKIATDTRYVTPGGLARLGGPATDFVVMGSGKTGMDVCMWLLGRNVPPERIIWIMPRDAWMFDRRRFQPGIEYSEFRLRGSIADNEAIIGASGIDDLFDRLAAAGSLLQLDPDVRPTAFKCATVSLAELEQLRTVKNVIRLGHVVAIRNGCAVLSEGETTTPYDAVYVDCTAAAIAGAPDVPAFSEKSIILQAVRACQPTFSAAFIAHVEARMESDATKNRLCSPVPYPLNATDWITLNLKSAMNQFLWMQHEEIRNWLRNCRLDIYPSVSRPAEAPPELEALYTRYSQTAGPALAKLRNLSRLLEPQVAAVV
jgi:hypothetical protein